MSHGPDALDTKIRNANALIQGLLTKQNYVVCSTKFGPDSLAFLHLISHVSNTIPIIWVDTGYNTRQTIQFSNKAKSLLGLNLHVVHPSDHVIRIPPALDDVEHAGFSDEVKLAPFREALETLSATHWLSSVRAYQTNHRQQLPTTMPLTARLTKVHPLLTWTQEHIDSYLERHHLPQGPDAFDPTKGESFRECGLHEQRSWV